MISIAISSLRSGAGAVAPAARNIMIARNLVPRHQRQLSNTCANSVHKLNNILEEYRSKNYSQEFPNRFRKDVVKAACAANSSRRDLDVPAVSADGIEHVLHNIGMGHRMSRSEIEGIVSEVGTCPIDDDGSSGKEGLISSHQMLDLISR